MWGHWSFGADIVVLKCLETSVEPQKGFRPYVAENGPYWGEQNPKSTGLRRAKAALTSDREPPSRAAAGREER